MKYLLILLDFLSMSIIWGVITSLVTTNPIVIITVAGFAGLVNGLEVNSRAGNKLLLPKRIILLAGPLTFLVILFTGFWVAPLGASFIQLVLGAIEFKTYGLVALLATTVFVTIWHFWYQEKS